MKDKLEILNTIKRVTPPDYLFVKILGRIDNKIKVSLIYTCTACILLLITCNIFFLSHYENENVGSMDLPNISINYLEYE